MGLLNLEEEITDGSPSRVIILSWRTQIGKEISMLASAAKITGKLVLFFSLETRESNVEIFDATQPFFHTISLASIHTYAFKANCRISLLQQCNNKHSPTYSLVSTRRVSLSV